MKKFSFGLPFYACGIFSLNILHVLCSKNIKGQRNTKFQATGESIKNV